MASAILELVWVTTLLKELGIEVTLPIDVYNSSKVAIQIAANLYFTRGRSI